MRYKGKYQQSQAEVESLNRAAALYITIIRNLTRKQCSLIEEKNALVEENGRLRQRVEEIARERDFLQGRSTEG